jgi:ribosomal protein S18 acetylase RimI-like enzyme
VSTKRKSTFVLNEKVIITGLTCEFATDLMKHSYFASARQRGDVLNHGLRYEMLKAVKLFPRATRLVAYHTEEKTAIGFLYLEENTDWLYTIEYVFVDQKYRKMGLATNLINYALMLARELGAKKVNLNVASSSTKAIELYKKLGFRKIGQTFLVQGYLLGSAPLRLVKRTIMGQGCLTKLALKRKGLLFELETNSRKNRETLFGIYQRSMNQEWINFFEITPCNLINGSRHVWQPPFFRDALINELENSFALIFNLPFSSKATVELYGSSDSGVLSVLEDLLKILAKRGISFTQIALFNPINNAFSSLLEEKGMMTYEFVAMGQTL